jgi:hypothetical protein
MLTMLTRRAAAAALVATAAALPGGPATAQNPTVVNVVPESATETLHAQITALDSRSRRVTLRGANGRSVTVTAGPAVRLDALKVGDTVNATYHRSVAFLVSPPGAPVAPDAIAAAAARPVQGPGGVAIEVVRVSGAIVGIHPSSQTVDMVDPAGGGVITVHVTDPARVAMLGTLRVGETITVVISQTLAASIEPSQGWFNWR